MSICCSKVSYHTHTQKRLNSASEYVSTINGVTHWRIFLVRTLKVSHTIDNASCMTQTRLSRICTKWEYYQGKFAWQHLNTVTCKLSQKIFFIQRTISIARSTQPL